MNDDSFHNELKHVMDNFVQRVYSESRGFPKEEIYGVTSQLRRASLSVILNYIEGFARNSTPSYKHFLDISYASLKESKYLLYFSYRQNFFSVQTYRELLKLNDRIGAMLWGIISRI